MQNPISDPIGRRRRRAASLPDDMIAEILARVPYRSLCRFKCVSRSWLVLCSDRGIRSRCPQTLSGFFYNFYRSGPSMRFVRTSERCAPIEDPLLSFLPASHRDIYVHIVDTCNGLLLCDRGLGHSILDPAPAPAGTRYFVCNPATGNWIDLPDVAQMKTRWLGQIIRLGFDPAVSSHFRVFLVVHAPVYFGLLQEVVGVQIYSSESKSWAYKQSGWGNDAIVSQDSRSAFFSGTLHLTSPGSPSSILTLDIDGKTWGNIATPCHFDFIGLSRGNLYAVHMDRGRHGDCRLSIWVLEDYATHKWTMKHHVMCSPRMFCMVYAIHPEDSLIFISVWMERVLLSYDFSNGKTCSVDKLGENSAHLYPYIPCFSDAP
ncbi:hypothetical protein BS78_09G211400 [Paspalum vaginatum]|nr:hypothetical protein BS78_09G211400 [Paspalum vaginatum]